MHLKYHLFCNTIDKLTSTATKEILTLLNFNFFKINDIQLIKSLTKLCLKLEFAGEKHV